MGTQQHPTISTLSLDRAALQVSTAVFCWLHTFSRQEDPFCVQPSGSTKQLHLLNQMVPLCAHFGTLLFLLGLAQVGVAGDMLQHPVGLPENLGGAPTCYTGSGEMLTMGPTYSSSTGLFSLLPESSHGSPTFSRQSLLFIVQRLFSWLTVFYLGFDLNTGVHLIYSCKNVSSASTHRYHF